MLPSLHVARRVSLFRPKADALLLGSRLLRLRIPALVDRRNSLSHTLLVLTLCDSRRNARTVAAERAGTDGVAGLAGHGLLLLLL